PLHHRFRIKIVAAGELLDRSLRSLYSSSDGVRGLGAAVKNLSHRASRNVASAWLIPRHSGTAHLGFEMCYARERRAAVTRSMRLGKPHTERPRSHLAPDPLGGRGYEVFHGLLPGVLALSAALGARGSRPGLV